MVVPWIYDAVAKSHLIWLNAKNCPFLHFFAILSKKNSSGCRSDNIDASMPPHSSFETLWPILFMENIQSGIIFKILGTRPLQSQLITICVPQKTCFSGLFLKKILVFSHFDQRKTPPSYTSLESYGSQLSNHVAESPNFWTCRPPEIWTFLYKSRF